MAVWQDNSAETKEREMQKEMNKLNQNLVHALSYALTGVESYSTWLADAKDIDPRTLRGYKAGLPE